ncbi:MAG: hypothetical protein ACP5O8_00990 [Candidatus Aenigmatarchaeota archaeon]
MNKILKVFCFAAAIFLILIGVSFSYFNESTSGEFNATGYVSLNPKNGFTENVSIVNEKNYNISVIFNNSSAVEFIYGPLNSSIFLVVINSTGDYSNESFVLNNSQVNFTLTAYCNETCFPGKYKSNFTIYNSTNTTENSTVEVEVDWPIFVDENGTGIFIGVFPYNSTTYHSFYFNTSNFTNSTGVTITLITLINASEEFGTEVNGTNYLDVFLLDEGGNLKAKSFISQTLCDNECFEIKTLSYRSLPGNKIWEMRIANSTKSVVYAGILTFTTLNITNESQTVNEIDFGGLNSTQNYKSTIIGLKNEGQRPLEIFSRPDFITFYYFKKFGGNGTKNFYVLIPGGEIVNYTEISLVWNGNSNYSLSVYDPLGNLKGESSNKSISAKVCGVEREEFLRITQENLIPGYWRIAVTNTTPSDDNYNLTVFLYLNSRDWVSTNFSQTILNYTNTTFVNVSLRLGKAALDGEYGGVISYLHDGYGLSWVQVPIHAFVNTSMLVVNGTFNSSLIKLTENTGFNTTKTLNITVENPGSYNLTLSSSSSLVLGSSTKNISLSFKAPSSIPPNSSGWLNITLEINTLNTSDTPGLYEGWVYLNSSEAQPYQAFNLTLQVNLTNELKVEIYDLKTKDGNKEIENPSLSENITLIFNVSLVNGTKLTNLLNDSFSVWLNHANVSFRIPSEGDFDVTNASGEIFKGNYSVNFTLPAQEPGGLYTVSLKTTYRSLIGESNFKYLLINDTGLKMTLLTGEPSLSNGSSYLVNVSIDNFGPSNAINAKIKITPGNCLASVAFHSGKCEGVTLTGGSEVTFNLSANKANACYVVWNITAGTPSDTTSTCDSKIEGISGTWFWNLTFWTTVTKQTGGGPGGGQPSYFYNLTFIKAETLIILKQNSTNSTVVIVKNTGNASQEISFGILNINSSWYKINSTGATLAPNQQVAFLVNFTVGMEEAKDYAGRFRVYSPNKTIISDFTLRILPLVVTNESQIREIKDTLLLYKVKMLNYSLQINASKEKGYNVSAAEEILSELKKKIEEAENYVAQGNYSAAQELFPTIQTLLNQLEEELGKITKPEEGLNWTLIVIVIVGAVGAIALIYLFWPTKTGYIAEKKKYVYKPKREKIRKELKERWEEVTKRSK